MSEQLLGAWQIHNRTLQFLLDAVPDAALSAKPQGMSGRSVGELFAHIHKSAPSTLDILAAYRPYANRYQQQTEVEYRVFSTAPVSVDSTIQPTFHL
jgi:hypothetical protein